MGVSFFFYLTQDRHGKYILKKKYIYKQLDYIYLDMNGAIHPAVKKDPNMKIEDMYDAVIEYIEKIIKFANPQKGIFMAVDGVAPIAKMEQQRMRRYKSVRDSKAIREIKMKHRIDFTDNGIDFNMISPGTEFMATLSDKLRVYIQKKKKTDWKNLKIHLSDASIPGEGEHKIMNHIRDELPKGYRPAIYGLDADLIFLSLLNCPTESVLLRETIHFDRNRGSPDPDELEFTYLLVDELRNIICKMLSPIVSIGELEQFQIYNKVQMPDIMDLKNPKYKFYDGSEKQKRRLILDYAFFCFALGNDFLPHLPSLRIRDGGHEIAMLAYKSVAWRMGGFLVNHNGVDINNDFLLKMLLEFAEIEDKYLQELTKKREIRVRKTLKRIGFKPPYERELELRRYIEHSVKDNLQMGFKDWRKRYYDDQFNIKFTHRDEFKRQINPICEQYLIGMKWVLLYYQGKGHNWTWSYPYDASPSVDDLYNYLRYYDFNKIQFKSNQAVMPFVQLLSILPPESSHLLPKSINHLMTDNDSKIHYLYPLKIVMNTPPYKKFLWECHPLLPEIEHDKLTRLVNKYSKYLNKRDIIRNTNNKKRFEL